jgi:aryl-alcohol dehydrogenase-like predicted oxidoreductase
MEHRWAICYGLNSLGLEFLDLDQNRLVMKRVVIPGTDLEVSQMAYGTASYDGSFPTEDGLRFVAKYVEAGGNFLDTAHCYCFWIAGGDGASERFTGAAVREFGRDNLVIATKGGHVGMNGYPRPDAFMTPELVSRDLEESLDRLGLPSVDIYYLHRDDPRVPVGEVIDSMNEHVRAGRMRYLGASNWSVARYVEANEYAANKGLQPFVVLQNQWSLAEPNWTDLTSPGAMRFIEANEVPALVTHGITVAPYSPTANGYFATSGKRGGGYESELGRRQLAAVEKLAEIRGVTPNQIALAYLINQPSLVIPVLGTRDADHLADALGAAEIELSTEEMAGISAG